MILFLFHPGLTKVSCDACKKWLHNFRTGEVRTVACGPQRIQKPLVQGAQPPCLDGSGFRCPKGTPDLEAEVILTPRNMRTLLLYLRGRPHNFANTPLDPLLEENLAAVDAIYREYERTVSAEASQSAVLELLPLLLNKAR